MLILEGKLLRAEKILALASVELKPAGSFVQELETALRELCLKLDVPLPLWLDKNSKEFAKFRTTFFFPGQFTEEIPFERFQIQLLERH
ncbi:MAG: hypothetical protein Q4P65_02360 [Eubacteriales bacterium]|nr:hypothetical protein [Eubacteriales bacterium]